MTYTHLTTNELVMIETYYKEGIKVSDNKARRKAELLLLLM